jgi:hypothetical protein
MKTKVEIEGYEIEISLEGGMISVTAQKDDEVVEEFSINIEEDLEGAQGAQEGEEIQNFGDYDEEEDFSGDDLEDEMEGQDEEEDDDDDDDEAQDAREGAALESFQSFINKKN